MKHILTLALTAILALSFSNLNAQSLKKANKEYELYAFNLAIKSYREVIEKEPTNVEAISKMADCYFHLNQIEESVKWYQKAVVLQGVQPFTIFNYAHALMNLGKYDEAKEWFLNYAEGNPFFGLHYAENCEFAKSLQGIPALYRVKKEYVNKSASDFGPAFYGDKIVYSSARTDLKRTENQANSNWTGEAKNQLFITSPDDNGYLKQPDFLRSDLRNEFNMGPVSYSGDRKWVAITKNNFVNGTRHLPSSGMDLSIYTAEVTAEGDWRDAKPFPYNGSGYSSGYTWLNEDGTMLYFSSNRPDGYGGYDIYVSRKIGNTWDTPQNLGPVINSPGNEITPYLDDATLYFASDWHPGLGSFDLFKATEVNGNWDKIFHLGNTVNSPRDDYGLIFNSKTNTGYFTSNRLGGKGNEDIYHFSQLSDNVVITVRNASTGAPVANATIDFSACGEATFATNENGQYSFQALPGLDCEGIVSKIGYNSYAFKLSSDGRKNSQEIEIMLVREADKYIGQIVNARDNSSVAQVYIRATDQSDGKKIETTSDANGNYKLALLPNKTYVIRYSKMGFMDTHNRISTGNGSDKSILGVISFNPSSTTLETVNVNSGNTPNNAETDASVSTEEADAEIEKQEGYSVQVAATGLDDAIPIGRYKALEEIGNLYSRPESGYKKLRVGIFESREEAKEAQKKISAKGFKSTFIVNEKLGDTEGVEVYSIVEDKKPAMIAEEKPNTPVKEVAPVKKEEKEEVVVKGEFMVRLAAYRNPAYFKAAKVSDLGVIEQRRSGDFTIMYLAGFNNLKEAAKAKEEAVLSGFDSAYVVENKDGQLKKVSL